MAVSWIHFKKIILFGGEKPVRVICGGNSFFGFVV
jgi:hypothetical protein